LRGCGRLERRGKKPRLAGGRAAVVINDVLVMTSELAATVLASVRSCYRFEHESAISAASASASARRSL
jgi:hypothetical protein